MGVALGGSPVLRGLDLTVAPGDVVVVTGPNGSGKSTLLRLLATLLRPAVGRLDVFGASGAALRAPAVRRRIGLVGHEPALHPELTVGENLRFVARLAGRDPDLVAPMLATVGLARASGRPSRVCSAGMSRRAELARVLLCQPDLLLLDEAHAALDAAARDLVGLVTADVVARGGAAVLVTHEPHALARMQHRLLHLSQGQLVPAAGGGS